MGKLLSRYLNDIGLAGGGVAGASVCAAGLAGASLGIFSSYLLSMPKILFILGIVHVHSSNFSILIDLMLVFACFWVYELLRCYIYPIGRRTQGASIYAGTMTADRAVLIYKEVIAGGSQDTSVCAGNMTASRAVLTYKKVIAGGSQYTT